MKYKYEKEREEKMRKANFTHLLRSSYHRFHECRNVKVPPYIKNTRIKIKNNFYL